MKLCSHPRSNPTLKSIIPALVEVVINSSKSARYSQRRLVLLSLRALEATLNHLLTGITEQRYVYST
jgi:hypothetical protein